jgi:nucleotide-binding universal stress UspA family protein
MKLNHMHYLVAYDLKANHNSPLGWTSEKLYKSGDLITIVSVIQEEAAALTTGSEEMVRSEILSQIHHLEAQLGKINAHINISLHSNPGESIVAMSKELQPDMIVMGSRGRNPLTSMILGSVSMYVLQNSSIPVTILKSE